MASSLQVHKAVQDNNWGSAFRTPGLIRFVSQEQAYLSTANDGPHVYINIEDYLGRPGHPNEAFQVLHCSCCRAWHVVDSSPHSRD